MLHRCDTRSCANPEHLFLGSHTDNMRDMAQKRRGRTPDNRGERNGQTQLTDDDVRAMRKRFAAGASQASLVREFRASKTTVSMIVRGLAWVHLREDDEHGEQSSSDRAAG